MGYSLLLLPLGLILWRIKAYLDARRRRAAALWVAAAGHFGLTVNPGAARRICGVIDGVPVHVEAAPGGRRGGTPTRLVARPERMPAGLHVTPQTFTGRLSAALGVPTFQTGDAAFDRRYLTAGPEVETIALLDGVTRADLDAFLRVHGGQVEDGALTMAAGARIRSVADVLARVRTIVTLARRLSLEGPPLAERLRANVESHTVSPVGARNLDLLLRDFPRAPETLAACAWAADEMADPAVRLRAGRHLGAAGWPHLMRLMAAPGIPGPIRRAALESLVQSMPSAELTAVLESQVDGVDEEFAPAVVRVLGSLAAASAFDRVVGRSAAAHAPLAAAIAQALPRLDARRAEPVLLRLLQRPEPGVRAAAARALAEVGTLSAIESLRACERAGSLAREPEEHEAVRAAIASILERLGNPEAGRLSLAAEHEESGALSMAGAGGELSSAPEGVTREA